jgi:hypothetical protein
MSEAALAILPPNAQTTETSAARPYGWILSPVIDLLFCCGGLVWIVFALRTFFIGGDTSPMSLSVQAFALLAVVGTHALSESHTAATLVRIYRSPESVKQYSAYTHTAAIVCGALALAALFIGGLTAVFAKVYLLWVIQHFTAQTYGIALVYCYKGGYRLSDWEKRILFLLMNSTAAYAILRQLTWSEWNGDGFLGMEIPFWGPLPPQFAEFALLCVFGTAALFGQAVTRRALQGQMLPLPALLVICTGVILFILPRSVSSLLWLYVPAFYHGSQYLVLTTACYLKEKGLPENLPTSQIATLLFKSDAVRYGSLLFLIGMGIYIGLPRLLQEFGFDYTLTFATIFSVVNLHHFITDQAIWKLRDPVLRKIVLS